MISKTTLSICLMIIIYGELIFPQYLEHYDFFFGPKEKRELISKLRIKTEKEIEKHIKTKSLDSSIVIRKYYFDIKGDFARYELYKDSLGSIPTSECDFYKDVSKNSLEVTVKGKLNARREYDNEGNKTLEINFNDYVIDTVEQIEYTYDKINNENLLTSITELRKNFSKENCKKYIIGYDSSGRVINRKVLWPNGVLSMAKHWDYDSLNCYSKSYTQDANLSSRSFQKFDDDGNVIETVKYNPVLNSMDTSFSEYNEEGRLISSINHFQGHDYRGKWKYDENGNTLEAKLFEDNILYSSEITTYYDNQLPRQRIIEDFKTGKKIIKNFVYEFY